MNENTNQKITVDRNDVYRQYTCSGGKGGQNVNRRSTCVILLHKPTGIIVRSEESRTQGKNEEAAWVRLEEKLQKLNDNQHIDEVKSVRFEQIGYGDRNYKRRTYRIVDGFVLDHISGKRITTKELYKGKIKSLHNKS
jgi:peptide chain release factor 1